MLIREALKNELPRILVLLKELDHKADPSPEKARAVWQKLQRYPDYRIYAAIMEEEIAGAFSLLIVDNLGHGGAPFAILDNVAVDPRLQGQGIGKAMIF